MDMIVNVKVRIVEDSSSTRFFEYNGRTYTNSNHSFLNFRSNNHINISGADYLNLFDSEIFQITCNQRDPRIIRGIDIITNNGLLNAIRNKINNSVYEKNAALKSKKNKRCDSDVLEREASKVYDFTQSIDIMKQRDRKYENKKSSFKTRDDFERVIQNLEDIVDDENCDINFTGEEYEPEFDENE